MCVGCVIVSYNIPGLITRAVKSIKDHVDEIIVVDNSSRNNVAYKEADSLGVKVRHTLKNMARGLIWE
jgi:glycosyltransferase involved in cell wall biosynthesis